ncbi:MAG: hypothetical protein HRT57_06185 [Crocinitomicaceae bacterium]|nr:hypothetical protein [Crocinitomicaceae bacterium]
MKYHYNFKPAVLDSSIELNFDDGSVMQMMNNMWSDNTTLGSGNRYFWDEIELKEFNSLFDQPLELFNPKFNRKARFEAFEKLSVSIDKKFKNMKYVVGLHTESTQRPK